MFGEWCQKTNKTEDTNKLIQECVTVVLRSIPQEAIADSFQKLYERCQPCVVNDGAYLEDQSS
jgi:hypothetical protein